MFNKLLVYPLFNLLILIYALLPGHDFGLAIIVLTVIIRLALWPLVARQLHSQRALQDLAPELAKVRAKAKGDKQLESRMLMELYKQKEVNPFSSIGLALIQLPLLIALFIVLRDVIKPGEIARLVYEPLRSLGAVRDIIGEAGAFQPQLFGLIDLSRRNAVLALLAGITQYFQTKQLTPARPAGGAKDPSAQALQTTTMIFPVLTAAFAFYLPAALALYWSATSLVAVGQQRIIIGRSVHAVEEGKRDI